MPFLTFWLKLCKSCEEKKNYANIYRIICIKELLYMRRRFDVTQSSCEHIIMMLVFLERNHIIWDDFFFQINSNKLLAWRHWCTTLKTIWDIFKMKGKKGKQGIEE